jgi:hypothetical protein
MPTAAEPVVRHEAETSAAPLLVDLGKQSRKSVRRLREGRGPLLEEITSAIDELREAGKIGANAQPVVVIVRQRRRRNALWPLA